MFWRRRDADKRCNKNFLGTDYSAQSTDDTPLFQYGQCLRLLGLFFMHMKKNGGENGGILAPYFEGRLRFVIHLV